MMKNQSIKRAGTLLVAVMIVTSLNAQSHGRGHYGMSQKASLELSEEQQTQMTALRTEHYKTMKPLKNKMTELKAREKTLLSEETVDMKAVHKVIDDQTTLMNQMRKMQVEHQVTVRGILTDEQMMKLEQRRDRPGQRRTNGNEFSRPPYRGGPNHRNMG